MSSHFFKKISQTFLAGILFILPIFLSVYILVWVAGGLDRISNNLLSLISHDIQLPKGSGFVIGALIIYAIGLSSGFLIAKWVTDIIERIVKKIPIVGPIFEGLKNLADYLNPQKQKNRGQTVVVSIPGTETKLIGFMTQSQLKKFPKELQDADRVAVYIPMSYMVGGITIFVPRTHVQEVDIPFDKAMPGALTAWVQNDEDSQKA